MTRQRCVGAWLLVIAVLAGGCAAGKAFKQGQEAAQAGNLDEAVAAYRRAVQASPNNTEYRIALEFCNSRVGVPGAGDRPGSFERQRIIVGAKDVED